MFLTALPALSIPRMIPIVPRLFLVAGWWMAVCGCATAADGLTGLVEDTHLEAHGFVSFGYYRTWENNYLDNDSLDGSTDLYEAALNATLRPFERVRVGAQLYVRDLGRYENGAVRLDWAFAEYAVDPALVVQAGRVKVPLGLYNELQDIDPARTTVFLPQSIYPIRLRDSQVVVDGGKAAGFLDFPEVTSFEYAVYGGTKSIEPDGAFSASSSERLRATTTDIDVDWTVGAMLEWNTPIEGLGLRVSYTYTNHLVQTAEGALGTVFQETDVEIVVLSLEWEDPQWTLAGEYAFSGNDGEVRTPTVVRPIERDYNAGYVSATWHARTWLDAYAAVEYQHSYQAGVVSDGWAYVAAINLMPLPNWSLKAEFQLHDGEIGILASDNPQGVSNSWQVLAFKTTVDF